MIEDWWNRFIDWIFGVSGDGVETNYDDDDMPWW